MKIVKGVRPICDGCRVVRKNGKVFLIHKGDNKHVTSQE